MPRTKISKRPLRRIFLAEWREKRDLTQEELADLLVTSHVSISRIERGIQPYNQRFLEKAAAALHCDPADIIARDPRDPAPVWKLWDSLTPAQREQAIAVIHALVEVGAESQRHDSLAQRAGGEPLGLAEESAAYRSRTRRRR